MNNNSSFSQDIPSLATQHAKYPAMLTRMTQTASERGNEKINKKHGKFAHDMWQRGKWSKKKEKCWVCSSKCAQLVVHESKPIRSRRIKRDRSECVENCLKNCIVLNSTFISLVCHLKRGQMTVRDAFFSSSCGNQRLFHGSLDSSFSPRSLLLASARWLCRDWMLLNGTQWSWRAKKKGSGKEYFMNAKLLWQWICRRLVDSNVLRFHWIHIVEAGAHSWKWATISIFAQMKRGGERNVGWL